jgi:hypothetical protein
MLLVGVVLMKIFLEGLSCVFLLVAFVPGGGPPEQNIPSICFVAIGMFFALFALRKTPEHLRSNRATSKLEDMITSAPLGATLRLATSAFMASRGKDFSFRRTDLARLPWLKR